jgi:hypothetical protein
MKNNTAIICLTIIASAFLFFASHLVQAQSGSVIFLGATPGTTLAANCPAAPPTPSVCTVGDGVWIWESSTTGWYKPAVPGVTTGIQSVTVCNAAGTTCAAPNIGPAVTLNIPTKVVLAVPSPTVSQATSSATLQ